MEGFTSPLSNQIFVVSGVLSTILSCGLGLGFLNAFLDHGDHKCEYSNTASFIETVGEIAFVLSIVIIPCTMQRKGRKIANLATVVPLLLSWLISFDVTSKDQHYISLTIINILHNISLGGAVAISSVIISEFCSPKYRATFLMLETAMISLGVLISHVFGMYSYWAIISSLGVLSSLVSLIVTYLWPESPYWLISQGHIVKCTENFHWLRGHNEDIKELEALLLTYRIKFQLEALKPMRTCGFQEMILDYLKSLLTADFLKPLSIMILLLSFVGFGSENLVTNCSFRDIFQLSNGKFIGTIVLDVLTLVCSLTACILVQIVKRKTLFLFTGSFSIIFLSLMSLFLFLQTFEMFSQDYMWLFLTFVTGFVMFMSLGTTALPFSLIGEIFPMSYKGVGSSLTCAYLWAFGNSLLKLTPRLTETIGIHGVLLLALIFMIVILLILNKLMPETNTETLLEIEKLVKLGKDCGDDYEIVKANEQDETENNFDKLKLFIEL